MANFQRDYINNKSVFYHFLDGLINEESGNITNNVIEYIHTHILSKSTNEVIYFLNLENTDGINLSGSGHSHLYMIDDDNTGVYKTKNFIKLLQASKFIIIPLSFNNHSTSLILFYKDNKYHIMLLNSGKGIENHTKFSDNIYKPYIILSYSDINEIINILFFINFYRLINTDQQILNLYLQHLKTMFENYDFEVEETNNINNYNYYKILNNDYYLILFKLFDKLYLANNLNTIDQLIINNLQHIEQQNELETKNINAKIIKKIKFHYYHNNIFIISQQSGSCSWFSKYWALCLYYLIFKPDEYSDFIYNIYSLFLDTIKKIFTYDNFTTELNNPNSCIILMNNLHLKLINLNIFTIKDSYIIDIHNQHIVTIPKIKLEDISNYYYKFKNKTNNNSIINILSNICLISGNNTIKFHNTFFMNICKYIHKKYENLNSNYFINNENILNNEEILNKKYNFISNCNKLEIQFNSLFNEDENKDILSIIIKNTFPSNLIIKRYLKIINLIKLFYKIKYIDSNKIYYNQYNLYNIIKYLLNISDTQIIINYTKILHKIIIIIKILHNYKSIYIIENELIENICKNELLHKYKIKILEYYNSFMFKLYEELISLFINKNNIKDFNYDKFNQINIIKFNHINHDKYDIIKPIIFNSNILNNVYEDIEIDINYINEEINLLLLKPSYIFNNYLSKESFDNLSLIIKLNINYINTNNTIKISLLKYFLNLYIKYKLDDNIRNITICLIHIQLLLFNCHSDINIDGLEIYNYYQYNNPDINLEILDELLYTIYKSKNNQELFIKYLLSNLDIFKNLDSIKDLLFKKHNISINSIINYESIDGIFNKLLNIKSYSIIFKHNNMLYIVNYEYYLILELDENNNIQEIYYNDNKVIKYNDINEPFKNMIPTNCFHLIYKKNNQFNITYFINNNLNQLDKKQDSILNDIQYNYLITTIRISKENMFLPINDDIEILQLLINNYGYNMLNLIYIIKKSNYGYIINNYEYRNNIIEINYNTFINFDNDSFNLINDNINSNKETNSYPFTDIINIKYNNIFLKSLLKLKKKIIKYNNINIKQKITVLIGAYTILKTKIVKLILNISNIKELLSSNMQLLIENMACFKIINSLSNILMNNSIELDNIYKSNLKSIPVNLSFELDSTIKIYSELFNNRKNKFEYLFEYIFEFIYGYEILDEQFFKYKEIISNFVALDTLYTKPREDKTLTIFEVNRDFGEYQIGGDLYKYNSTKIRVDKFMMGKGKSTVLTPLLSLYFTLIHNKTVYIIVPQHLKKQTENIMKQFIYFFKLSKKIIIMSDIEIKQLHLYEIGNENIKKQIYNTPPLHTKIIKNSIMLIDEFDTILDPSKGNFNIKLSCKDNINEQIINYILYNFFVFKTEFITPDFYPNLSIINEEIKIINMQLKNNILKENINWGIHPTNGYAIPFFNKDKADLNSTFSSVIMTIYLTLYYYLELKKGEINDNMCNYIIHNNILQKLFNKDIINVTETDISIIFNNYLNKIKILKHIINNIKLTDSQLNISFIDILIRDNIYKIGYSGTLNINFPKINKEYNDKDDYDKIINNEYNINDDYDEIINIEYAIKNNETVIINNTIAIFNNKYDAYIDICGIFKNDKNQILAMKLHEEFNRPIIFIDELDIIKVIINNNIDIYNNNDLDKPIFYYDQAHIIGIDIKQEKYPILKGLCIVDSKTKYTEIAQGIFRLRKINLGHTVDIYITDIIETDKIKLFDLFIENDKTDKENKKLMFNYQNYKALIRKDNYKLTKTSVEKHSNEEIVKYYFNNTTNNTETISSLLSNIVDVNQELLSKFNINNISELYKLIYNIGIIGSQQEQELEQQLEKEQEHTYLININNNLTTIKEKVKFKYILIKYIDDPYQISYHYKYFEKDILNNIIGNDIYFIPNIFTFNLTGLAFILIDNKLLLVPGHMIKIFIKKYPIFNVYLNQINDIEYNYDIIELIKNKYVLFKILYNKIDNKFLPNLFGKNKYLCNILFIILINIMNNDTNMDIINLLIDKYNINGIDHNRDYNIIDDDNIKKYFCDLSSIIYDSGILTYSLEHPSIYFENTLFHSAHNKLYSIIHKKDKKDKIDLTIKKKYLKYKTKYLSLKNN